MAAPCRYPTQLASIAAWNDDAHAATNRALYREKFARVLPILPPRARRRRTGRRLTSGLTCSATTGAFTRALFATQNLTILRAVYLARDTGGRQSRPAAGTHFAGGLSTNVSTRRNAYAISWRVISD